MQQLRYEEMAVLRNRVLLPIHEWAFMNRSLFQGFLDLDLKVTAYGAAFLLVYQGRLPVVLQEKLLTTLPLVCGMKSCSLLLFRPVWGNMPPVEAW